ncbi:hypothetical protein MBLNU457_g0116t2 [Dothideomycetes sp. NU457]
MDLEGMKNGIKSMTKSRRASNGAASYPYTEEPRFIAPSYLRSCRYLERLHDVHRARLQHLRESRLAQQPPQHGLGSRTPSSSNLKQQSSLGSRTITQDVVERLAPPTVDEDLAPLPSRWSDSEKCAGLEVLGDGYEIRFNGVVKAPDDAATVRTDHPIPKECGVYYFETSILSRGKDHLVGVGFSTSKPSLNRLPGWESESWGYHSDDGMSFQCSASGKVYGPKFSASDTVGCGINFRNGTAFFTKNGVALGEAFPNALGPAMRHYQLYPSVGVKKPGEHVRVNLGQSPFVFDIDSYVENERRSIMAEIDSTDVSKSSIHPTLDETETIQELISQYLNHEGYVEAAKQFSQDVQSQRQSLFGGETAKLLDPQDDVDALNRQKIRLAILEGDMDKAFKYLHAYYPHVLEAEENRDVYFRLRCRKFIEMIRRSYEGSMSKPSNGHKTNNNTDGFDHQMELDDQLQRETRPAGDDMDMDHDDGRSSTARNNDLLTEAVQYGMELRIEFGADSKKEIDKELTDTFGLLAYTDARDSALAGLMEGKGRVEIAEQVNGAILVSLGKPRSALLEKVCAQTEVLVEMLSAEGGPAAFINVQQDYLR